MWSKTTESLLISLFVICFHDLGKSPAALTIDHSRHNYTTVPQNLTKTVTKLVLAFNNISRIDNTSFANYKDLQHINFENNSLKYILEGSFDNNPHLKTLIFKHCELRRLPPSFGPSTPFMENLDFGDAIEPDATGTIRNQYLAPFTSLVYLRLTGVDLFTLEDIFLPRSLQTLSVAYCRLSVFPNVSADRLPALERLFIYGNPLQAIPDDMFAGISDSIIQFVAASADLSVAPNLALKKRLSSVILKGNNLETLNDLLEELPLLDEILLEKNGRWTCDKRMCWWRLWERVRTEITFDNPQCVNPASLGNFTLRDVNPKFMDCFNGMVLYMLTTQSVWLKGHCFSPHSIMYL